MATRKLKRQKSYRFGIAAEHIAGAYLRCKLYRILALRYRNYGGEIDIIARRGNTLIAVEVKARRALKDCEYSITPHKQQKIARAVNGLLGGQGNISGLGDMRNLNIRFDAVWVAPWRMPIHLKDAWRL